MKLKLSQGLKTVAAAGTAEALVSQPTTARTIILQPQKASRAANTGNVYIGTRERQLLVLTPTSAPITLNDLNQTNRPFALEDIFVDAANNDDGVAWTILN